MLNQSIIIVVADAKEWSRNSRAYTVILNLESLPNIDLLLDFWRPDKLKISDIVFYSIWCIYLWWIFQMPFWTFLLFVSLTSISSLKNALHLGKTTSCCLLTNKFPWFPEFLCYMKYLKNNKSTFSPWFCRLK